MKRQVVVTGMGTITPIGHNVDEFWQNALKGIVGIDEITAFDVKEAKVKWAAEVKELQPKEHFDRKWVKRLDRFSQFAMIAAREAYKDAGLDACQIQREKIGICMGTGVGGMTSLMKEAQNLFADGMNYVSPLCVPKFLPNMATGNIAIDLDIRGFTNTVVTACASGTNAVGEAYRAIQHGYVDVMVAGGSEACITPLMMASFTNMNALTDSEDPHRASIPFDAERRGFVLGEGAGVLILEAYDHAVQRNARIYAEVSGYGFSSDAYHLTAPCPDGEGAYRAMTLALSDAGIESNALSYINAHGTSTPLNDAMESKALKKLLGEQGCQIPISSTKSMIGHLQGAAGAVEAIACVKAIEDQIIHGTAGYRVKDTECDLDYVTNGSRALEVKHVLSNSFGFGGHNASLVFSHLIK